VTIPPPPSWGRWLGAIRAETVGAWERPHPSRFAVHPPREGRERVSQGPPSVRPKNSSAMAIAARCVASCGTLALHTGTAATPAGVQSAMKS